MNQSTLEQQFKQLEVQESRSLWELFEELPDGVKGDVFAHCSASTKRHLRLACRRLRQLLDESIKVLCISRLATDPQDAAIQAAAYRHFTSVRTLRIASDGMSSGALEQFVRFAPDIIERLEVLEAGDGGLVVADEVWAALLAACRPHTLRRWSPAAANRRRPAFLSQGVQSLLAHQARVTHLDLSLSRATDGLLAQVATRLPQLQVLDLSACTLVTDTGVGALAALPHLHTLTLDKTLIQGECFRDLAAAPSLTALHLGLCSHLTASGAAHVAALPRLRALAIHRHPACFPALGALAAGRAAASLQSLSLLTSTLRDEAIQAVAQLTGLTALDITDCSLGFTHAPSALQGLAPLSALTRLSTLTATNTTIHSPAQFQSYAAQGEACDLRLRAVLPPNATRVLRPQPRLHL